MLVDGHAYRSIWLAEDGRAVEIVDQTLLPHRFETRRLETLDDACEAIRVMRVRGAPLIGATAAYGMALAMADDASDARLCRLLNHGPRLVFRFVVVENRFESGVILCDERREQAPQVLRFITRRDEDRYERIIRRRSLPPGAPQVKDVAEEYQEKHRVDECEEDHHTVCAGG